MRPHNCSIVQFSSNPMVEWIMSKMNLIREACCPLAKLQGT